MSDTYYPIINIPAVPHPDGIRFLPLQSRAFTVSNYVDLVWKILAECNGRKSLGTITTAIREQLPNTSPEVVTAVIEHLSRVGVLVDIQQAWKSFHELTCQPMRYGNPSRESGEACLATQSRPAQWQANVGGTQTFRAEGLDREQLSSILADIWQSTVNPKPSAVELSLFRIYVIVVNDQAGLARGYYQYDASRQQLIHTKDIDDQQLRYAFNSDSLLGGAPVIAVIGIQPERYSCLNASRGYRTALIEIGRAVQRLISATTAGGLSALEYTDFLDGVLARELGLKETQCDVQVLPVSAVAIGYADGGKHVSTSQQVTMLSGLARKFVGGWIQAVGSLR
jgi:hypothetical protein